MASDNSRRLNLYAGTCLNLLGIVLSPPSGVRPSEIVRVVNPLSGGSKSVLVEDSDGDYWVVKRRDNPQGVGILANEAFGAMLGSAVGLPFPQWSPAWFSSELFGTEYSGMHFASRYIRQADCHRMSTFGIPQEESLCCGMTLFDVWTWHQDSREYLARNGKPPLFIDNGYLLATPNRVCNRARLTAVLRLWRYDREERAEWVRRMDAVTASQMSAMWSSIPPEWRADRSCPANQLRSRAAFLRKALLKPPPYARTNSSQH